VGALAALTALKLQHCRGIQRCADLAPLAALTALSALSLCGCTELRGQGISSLAPLTALRCAARARGGAPQRAQRARTRAGSPGHVEAGLPRHPCSTLCIRRALSKILVRYRVQPLQRA